MQRFKIETSYRFNYDSVSQAARCREVTLRSIAQIGRVYTIREAIRLIDRARAHRDHAARAGFYLP